MFLAAGILFLLSMASYHPHDPSWDSAVGNVPATNLIGPTGAFVADIFLQSFGIAAFLFPLFVFALGWKWIRSEALEAPLIKLFGQRDSPRRPHAARLLCCPDGGSSTTPSCRAEPPGF